MSITLTPRVEAVIQQKVASGLYASANEVIEAAVLLLDERDRFERLHASLLEAETQTREGKVVEWTPELRRQLRQEAEEMARRGNSSDPEVCPHRMPEDRPPPRV
ncbi:MAG: ribbon-helix-helix domain-containing protein [Thermomicrobiales bacterium]